MFSGHEFIGSGFVDSGIMFCSPMSHALTYPFLMEGFECREEWVKGYTLTCSMCIVIVTNSSSQLWYMYLSHVSGTFGFKQDNARPHSARHSEDNLLKTIVNVLHFPTKSWDLSPVQHLLDILGHEVRERENTNTVRETEACSSCGVGPCTCTTRTRICSI